MTTRRKEEYRDQTIHKASCPGCPACDTHETKPSSATTTEKSLKELHSLTGFTPPKGRGLSFEEYLNKYLNKK